jgi:hypothetical protein
MSQRVKKTGMTDTKWWAITHEAIWIYLLPCELFNSETSFTPNIAYIYLSMRIATFLILNLREVTAAAAYLPARLNTPQAMYLAAATCMNERVIELVV